MIIITVQLEVGLHIAGFALRYLQSARNEISTSKISIVILGESTSSDVFDPAIVSWPRQLNKLLTDSGTHVKFTNLSYPRTVTPILYKEFLDKFSEDPPEIVITMMGVNDSPYFWPQASGLIDDSIFRHFKIFQLLKSIASWGRQKGNLRRAPSNQNSPIYIAEPVLNYSPHITNEIMGEVSDNWSDKAESKFNYRYGNTLMPSWSEKEKTEFQPAIQIFKRALESSLEVEKVGEAFSQIALKFYPEECIWLAGRFLKEKKTPSPRILVNLAQCLDAKNPIAAEFFSTYAENYVVDGKSKAVPTRHIYELMSQWALEKDVCVVALTYPDNKTFDLKQIIEDLASDHFYVVDQEPSFTEALRSKKYEDIFTDDFGGTFGHATDQGNAIIANNIFLKLKELASNKKCGAEKWFESPNH